MSYLTEMFTDSVLKEYVEMKDSGWRLCCPGSFAYAPAKSAGLSNKNIALLDEP